MSSFATVANPSQRPGHRKTLAKHQCFLRAFECGGASVAQALRSAAIELSPRQLVSKRELAQLPRVREAVNRILLGGDAAQLPVDDECLFRAALNEAESQVNFPKKDVGVHQFSPRLSPPSTVNACRVG